MVSTALMLAALGLLSPGAQPASAQGDCVAPDGAPGCWEIDLVDEFMGNSLNLANWEPGWFVDQGFSRSVNHRENACYNTDQVTVQGGALHLRLDPSTSPLCLDKQGEVAPFVGGLISGRDSINNPAHPTRLDDTFYIESRIKLPAIDGQVRNWPAFWTAGGGPWPITGEIDVLEGLEGKAKYNYHFGCPAGGNCQFGAQAHPAASGDGEWHTYGAYRQLATTGDRATITYFFDGVAVGAVTERVVDTPQYLIFTYTSHESHNVTTAGVEMQVDWIRTWSPVNPSPGDVSCTLGVNISDALLIAQYSAGIRDDIATCPLPDPVTQINADVGDVNGDNQTDIVDALIIAQCTTGVINPNC